MAVGIRLFSERVGEGAGEPVLDAENGEELMHVQTGVSIVLGNRTSESPGTLYISTKYIYLSSYFSKYLYNTLLSTLLIFGYHEIYFHYLN